MVPYPKDWPQGYKTFFTLISVIMKFILLINVLKIPTIDGILTFINKINAASESFKK